MDRMEFGKRFRHLRKDHLNKSMAELSEILGISTSFISDLENGKSLPGAEILYSLYRKFSINSHWLVTGEGSMFVKASTGEGKTEAALRAAAALHDQGKASPAFGSTSVLEPEEGKATDQQELEKLEQENAELKVRLEQTERMLVLFIQPAVATKPPVSETEENTPAEPLLQRSGRLNRTLEKQVEHLEHNLETLQRFVQRIVFREGGAVLLEEPPEEEVPEGSNIHSVVYIKGTAKEKTKNPQEEPANERS